MSAEPRPDERDDYTDDPARPYGRFDSWFAGIYPIHFLFLVFLTPCYALFPATLFWAAIGLLVCRHETARRNAWILLLVGLIQMFHVAVFVYWDRIVAFART